MNKFQGFIDLKFCAANVLHLLLHLGNYFTKKALQKLKGFFLRYTILLI